MEPSSTPVGSPQAPPARAQRGAHVALLFLILINLFNYVDRYILATTQEPIEKELLAWSDNPKQLFGWLTPAFLVSYMLLSPVFGWLGDRGSRWKLIGIGVILWSLASGASGLAGGFVTLLITRMFVGVGEAAYGPVAPTLLSDLYPASARSRVMAWFYLAMPVGGAVGYLIGGWFANDAGWWRWAFYVVVPPGLLLGAIALFLRDPPRGRADAVAVPRRPTFADYAELFRIPSYVLNTVGATAMTFAIGGMAIWLPTFLRQRGAGDPDFVGLMVGAVIAAGGLVGTLAGGLLGDAVQKRYGGGYFLVSGLALLAAFAAMVAFLATPFPAAWILLFLTVALTFLNTGPSNAILANVTHPASRATAFALNILIIHALGDAISPVIMGAIADHYGGSLQPSFVLVSLLMLVGGVAWLWGARYLSRDTALAPTRLARS